MWADKHSTHWIPSLVLITALNISFLFMILHKLLYLLPLFFTDNGWVILRYIKALDFSAISNCMISLSFWSKKSIYTRLYMKNSVFRTMAIMEYNMSRKKAYWEPILLPINTMPFTIPTTWK